MINVFSSSLNLSVRTNCIKEFFTIEKLLSLMNTVTYYIYIFAVLLHTYEVGNIGRIKIGTGKDRYTRIATKK